MKKLIALFSLFRKGSEIANAEAWKKGQITSTIIGVFILALVQVAALYGIVLPIDPATANEIGVGIIAVVNVVLTVITSKKAGLAPPPIEDNRTELF